MTGRGAAQGCERVCVTGWFLKMRVGEGKEGGGAWGLKRTACSDTRVLKPVNTPNSLWKIIPARLDGWSRFTV